MAGIYVHIPYCRVKCHYCDFHFSTKTDSSNEMVDSICKEISKRSSYLNNEDVSTIYFGGGTPSILSEQQLSDLLAEIYKIHNVTSDCEITLECNPDDLTKEKLQELFNAGINRLSIGVQSFDDEVLTMMNRAHTSQEAIDSILYAKEIGFQNITADLIYGIPNKSLTYWEQQLMSLIQLDVQHISAYCLTIESNTVFGHQHKKGEFNLPEDEDALDQFTMMVEMLNDYGYEHYEVSNFAKKGFISKHNSAYWLGKPYIGIGPSAHSYNGDERGWNVSNNIAYIKGMKENSEIYGAEDLTYRDKFNDYILTRLRTIWGLELNDIEKKGENIALTEFSKEIEKHLELGNLIQVNDVIRLSEHGKFIADKIASDLFV